MVSLHVQMKKVFTIVEALWACTDIEKAIRSAYELLSATLYFERGIFWVLDPLSSAPARPPIAYNIPIDLIRDYILRIRPSLDDQAYRATRSAGLTIARSTDVLNYSKWTMTDIFHDIYLPYNGYFQLGSELRENGRIYGAYCLFRSKCLGDYSDADMGAVRLLYPHLVNRLKWQNILERSLIKPHDVTDTRAGVLASLTPRESEVVRAVLNGATNKEAAASLDISENTVKLYLKNIYGKLGVHSRSQLAALYNIWE